MSALPRWADGLSWAGWEYVEEPNRTPLMKFNKLVDTDGGTHIITIAESGFFEIFNVDGEIAWSATFPSVYRAWKAARGIIQGMF